MTPRSQVLILFCNFLLFGGIAATIGATVPLVLRSLGWSYAEMGIVIAANAGGYLVSTFTSGLLLQRFRPRTMIALGLLFQMAGLGFFGMTGGVVLNGLVFIVLGVGQGMIEVTTNYSVLHLEARGKSRLMNLIHAAFTIGAVIAPFLAGMMAWMNLSWRAMYWVMSGFCLVMLAPFLFGALAALRPAPADSGGKFGVGKYLKRPLLWMLALVIFFYVGAEIGISNWVSELYVEVYSLRPALGAFMVSLFWTGIFAGRMLSALLYHGERQSFVLCVCSALSSVSLFAALTTRDPVLSAALIFMTGMGFSIVYPACMTIVGQHFGADQGRGVAVGVVSTGGGLGVFLFPLVMSLISDRYDIGAGFWFYWALTVAMTLAAFVALRLGRDESA